MMWAVGTIRQHGIVLSMFVGMAVVVLYAVIQTKSRATPVEDRKPANEAYHDEAGTEQCT